MTQNEGLKEGDTKLGDVAKRIDDHVDSYDSMILVGHCVIQEAGLDVPLA